MHCALHLLNADGSLDRWETRIRAAFEDALKRVSAHLPIGAVDVIVYNDADYVVPELGMSGFCTSARRMYLPMDVENPVLPERLEQVFQGFFAHEMHHCVRRRISGFAETLGQALVTEGLACCFEAELPGGIVPIYARSSSGRSLDTIRSRAAALLDQPFSGWAEWFFGEREADIPRHAGYVLGYELVSAWLKRSGQTAAACVTVDAAEVIGAASWRVPDAWTVADH